MKPRLPTLQAPAPSGALPDTTLTAVPTPGAGASGPELVLHNSGRVMRVPLGAAPVTIGRDPSADVVLASRFVSAKHARVEPDGAGHRIVDLGSMNGILRAGRRMPKDAVAPLEDGDTLRIGDATTGSFVTLVYHNPAARSASPATTVVRRCPLPADRAVVTIGRKGADIELENPVVSRRHAVIERAGKGHVLRDLGSTNGTFVGGRRASRVSLTKGAVIQIGPFKLVYDGNSLSQYDQRGALRLDGRRLSQRVSNDRLILRDVSISIAPREFVALVGGSGAGKSTLMKALAGYAAATDGQVLVNGDDFYEHLDAYRALLGYVPQDDTLHRELPVARALSYAARLRLPADTSRAEIDERVARVLESVDMTAHRDKRVDQLSGGQRKRVSIAAELLADPSLFFLDEPTSGLDPGLEKRMMYTLRRLADGGRTIVLVTYATANITQCDHVAFMAEGRLVFFGPPADALRFFGVESGDFADIYGKLEGAADPGDRERWAVVEDDLQKELEAFRRAHPAARRPPSLAELWEHRYRGSRAYAENVVRRLAEVPVAAAPSRAAQPQRAPISAWAKTPDRAISVVPLVLIPQILFSGVLFPFGSGTSTTRILSWFTVSRWAMDAYGTTINLGRLPPPARPAAAEFAFTRDNLLLRWESLGAYTLGCLILACVLLWWRDRDA